MIWEKCAAQEGMRRVWPSLPAMNDTVNPCHAEEIKMPRPFPIVSQSDDLIWIVDISSHT